MLKGITMDSNKKMSITDEVVDMCDPSIVYVPLVNHTNLNCKCLTKVGKKVKKDTIIGMREDIELPILSPVSGTVIDISKCLYLNGESVDCVVIKNNGKESISKKESVDNISAYSKEGFIEILKMCAVTGMGGSDFPTYIKYKADLTTLVVNAVECEPYITADLMLCKLKSREILETIDAIMVINSIKKAIIAVKKGNTKVINSFKKNLLNYPNIKIVTVKDMYPMGWERHTIKSVLKIEYDRFPSEKGIVVNNVSTIFAIYKALKFQRATSKRLVTITGEMFKEPVNVLVKIGTNIHEVIEKLGGYKNKHNLKIIAGGPMMGTSLISDDVVVTKNLNCILIIENIDDYDEIACMRCGKCDHLCPAKISPVLIKNNINDKEYLEKLEPKRCMECGLCSYICPSKIDLRTYVKMAKKEVSK